MKVPKSIKRLCPYCKKHVAHKVTLAKRKTPGSAHPMGYGSKKRMKRRGEGRGAGNKGKLSKGAISGWKMTGKKVTKKSDFRYTCSECKKTHMQKKGIRAKRFELV
ncbi:50S ribosomal protein L44e [Candidatus Woesearchaeota archaeon CG_4_10_14_0_8_um_filter_47_5]|nr:MAG: 50S ribosomal protein L44e [Candidatus Woesearchaeota archaeon CG_4_10_14_0_8_um_filter_47_5]